MENRIPFTALAILLLLSVSPASRRDERVISAVEKSYQTPWIGCMHSNMLKGVDSSRYYPSFESIPEPIRKRVEREITANLGENWREQTQLYEAGVYLLGNNKLPADHLRFWFSYKVVDTVYLLEGRSNLDGTEFSLDYDIIRKSRTAPTYSLSKSWETVKELNAVPRFSRVSGEIQRRYIPHYYKKAWVIPMMRGLYFSLRVKYRLLIDIETGEFLGTFTNDEYFPLLRTGKPELLMDSTASGTE